MNARPNLLMIVPPAWSHFWQQPLSAGNLNALVEGKDSYKPEDIDYALGFRPTPGFLATLPKLKAVFSLGAGIDGFLSDPNYPKSVPLIRFVDDTLSREMAQYVVLHVLMQHRMEATFAAAQRQSKWAQQMLPRRTEDTRVGILGLGEIGTMCAERLRDLGFATSGWSRTRKSVDGVKSYAGAGELDAFLAQCDFMICVLPLTPETRGILNAAMFAKLPKGAYVINVARGGHLIEADLIAALDSGHLLGATLDVFQTEPLPESSPIWKHPKIVATPHVAAITAPAVAAQYVINGIATMERGERPANIVDLTRGY
jgi:glyoxylate/hydroxypyruvate reductase A